MATAAPSVLILDDDVDVTRCFTDILKLRDFDVRVARDVASGLRGAAERRPDAILLDLHLTPSDGLEFLRVLRGSAGLEGVPVALITGDYLVDDETIAEAARLGADLRYKPLWLDDLLDLVETLLRRGTA